MALIKQTKADKLDVRVYDTRKAMGDAAGNDVADKIVELLGKKDEINMIFAAAPSQNETLAALLERKDVDWTRVNAYHMDEYIGLPADAPQRFGLFLKEAIFSKVPFKSVNYIDCTGSDPEVECKRYGDIQRLKSTSLFSVSEKTDTSPSTIRLLQISTIRRLSSPLSLTLFAEPSRLTTDALQSLTMFPRLHLHLPFPHYSMQIICFAVCLHPQRRMRFITQ